MQITVTREFTTAEAGDIAITAAEGGTGYWGLIESYRPSRWEGAAFESIEVPEDFVFYTMHETLDDSGEAYDPEGIDITPTLIHLGVQRFLQQGRTFADMDDLGAMDSDEADVVIQLGAFNEVRYG
jgi:hypothetical protein